MVQLRRVLQTAVLLLDLASSTADVDVYCKLIDSKITNRIFYPGSSTYNESETSYYAGQESELQPGCIFRPEAAEDGEHASARTVSSYIVRRSLNEPLVFPVHEVSYNSG